MHVLVIGNVQRLWIRRPGITRQYAQSFEPLGFDKVNRFYQRLEESFHPPLVVDEKLPLRQKGVRRVSRAALSQVGQLSKAELFNRKVLRDRDDAALDGATHQGGGHFRLATDLEEAHVLARIEIGTLEKIASGEIADAAESTDPEPFAAKAGGVDNRRLGVNKKIQPVVQTAEQRQITIALQVRGDAADSAAGNHGQLSAE